MDRLPQDILERVDRLADFHKLTRYTPAIVRAEGTVLDFANQPSPRRVFVDAPKTPLPTTLLDSWAAMLPILGQGLAAVPPSQLNPAQDLRTLATWLFYASGQTAERRAGDLTFQLRSAPSMGALYPCEIYVAAFAIDGLEPGLYHFSVREFALRKLRDGAATLNQIKRGRPDLAFLKSVPAVLLVSTIFWRSAWRYRRRGYRAALLDAGHLVQNLVAAGNGLGIQTMPRMWINDRSMRDLIGISPEADFGSAEAVQSMVVWADSAAKPLQTTALPGAIEMPPIARQPLSRSFVSYDSILAAHLDCVAPGNPLRELRPPLTNTSAMPDTEPGVEMAVEAVDGEGRSVREVLLTRRSTSDFEPTAISRRQLLAINHAAFVTGTFPPILPDGPHIGLVRPFWIIHSVTGVESGLWLFHPQADRWWMMRPGRFRAAAQTLMAEQPPAASASAVCVLCANLGYLMENGGPDTYRLAHLEAGIAAQRITLGAGALGLSCRGLAAFYDEAIKEFFGLARTRWEPLHATAVGVASRELGPFQVPALEAGWRG